jgi:WXG100 family type VII secretion target
MTQFSVVAAHVNRSAASAEAACADLLADVDRLRGEAEDLLSARWLGAAAAVFERDWTRWDADARAVLRALDELAQALRLAARDYVVGDAVAAERLRMAW